jgi:hypothetical protein
LISKSIDFSGEIWKLNVIPTPIYVKTVLTFGDKPTPAMAQIALRKTAEESEEVYPKAAKV